jgi:hypothetical protein
MSGDGCAVICITNPALSGGCLCGALRCTLVPPVIDAGHCPTCRRAHAAPVVAWLLAPLDAFAYVGGTPAYYASSPDFQREFCAHCGCQLVFRR